MLVQCPECAGQMSDSADACPHCGAPNQKLARAKRLVDALSVGMPRCPVCRSVNVDYIGSLAGGLRGGLSGFSKRHVCSACGHQF